jgi:hypothetical protein
VRIVGKPDPTERVTQLDTPAVQSTNGRNPSEKPAYLVINAGGVAMLRMQGGTWALGTLIGLDGYLAEGLHRPGALSIDFGQGWICENAGALVEECLARLIGTWGEYSKTLARRAGKAKP